MVKLKRSHILVSVAIVLVFIGCAASYAAIQNSTGVKNTFNTGGINIDVENFTVKNGKEVPMDYMTTVDFNGKASYIPIVTNNAESAYLRFKVFAETEIQNIDIVKDLYGISDNLILKPDGYLYLTEPLEHKGSIKLCQGFDIPDSWDYMKSNKLDMKVTADAIQSVNFNPDFTSDVPWGDVVISESNVGDDYELNTVLPGEDGNIKVVYANTVKGITINSDDFFKDVKFMPGDKYSDTLTLNNKTAKSAKILFKTEFNESDLLNIMQLNINNGSTFYDGFMASHSLKEYKQIAELKPGESKKIDVILTLPAEANNNYQVLSDMATWYFAIEQPNDIPKTGDNTPLWLIAGLCFISSMGALFLARKRKDEDI